MAGPALNSHSQSLSARHPDSLFMAYDGWKIYIFVCLCIYWVSASSPDTIHHVRHLTVQSLSQPHQLQHQPQHILYKEFFFTYRSSNESEGQLTV